jgi:Polyprenyl synthetase
VDIIDLHAVDFLMRQLPVVNMNRVDTTAMVQLVFNILNVMFDSDLKPLLDNLGLYFQIRDDYANLNSQEASVFI